jgi:ribosomal subunit interface protein
MTMNVSPEIIFHHVDRSDWVEGFIAERLERLERYATGITSCHVTLAREQTSQHKGNIYSVLVDVRIPPNHELTARKERAVADMGTELRALINTSFQAVEKQLKKTAELRRGE